MGYFFTQIFVQKKSLEEGPISQKWWKTCKISHFRDRKPLEMGPDLWKFQKNSQISHFLREKNP